MSEINALREENNDLRSMLGQ